MTGARGASGALGALGAALLLAVPLVAQEVRIDLSKEVVGRPPTVFEPEMGTWVVAQDGQDKVIKVDGVAYKASLDTPTRLLLDNARRLYGTSNEDLMDNAKQFTAFPVAVLKTVNSFSNGTISVKFKTIAGNADRASGILFNLKPNGDWLCIRYNDTENNVGLWEFHNGVRRLVRFSDRAKPFPLDKTADGIVRTWHELKMTVNGADFKSWVDGTIAIEYTLGTMPGNNARTGAPPNPDLIPANNPVLQPPVSGRVGLWSKTDSTVEFKDFVIQHVK